MSMPMEPAEALLEPRQFGLARVAIGKALYWRYRLFHKRRLEGCVLEHLGGMPVLVTPGVLNPRWMRTGKFFASQLTPALVARDAEVLDMGTGSGVCALFAARHAKSVAAVDISPDAVRCARINVLMNRLEDRIEVLEGDLFAPLAGRRFDLILFNPPFLPGSPRDDADRAWRSVDVAERFADGLHGHLKPGGAALVLLSTYGGASRFVREFQRHSLVMEVVREREYINEKLTILRLTQGPA